MCIRSQYKYTYLPITFAALSACREFVFYRIAKRQHFAIEVAFSLLQTLNVWTFEAEIDQEAITLKRLRKSRISYYDGQGSLGLLLMALHFNSS